MNRRGFLRDVAMPTLGVVLGTPALAVADRTRPPNVVVVLVDDMGWRDVGYAGNSFLETPNIDRLAGRGVVFTQAYAAAPNCAPTRASLMTGLYPPRHGVYTVVDENQVPGMPHHLVMAAESKAELEKRFETIAEVLSLQGYATAMVGMWNLAKGRNRPLAPTGRGFQSYVEPKTLGFERDAYHNDKGEYLTDRLTDAGLGFIRTSRDKPFFLYLAYHAVHSPFAPKPELLAKYRGKGAGSEELAAYAATIEALDQNIGRIWALLDALDLAGTTYLMLTSDNGATHSYTAPLRDGKGTLYEGGIRVPAFMVGPGIPPGSENDTPISSIDFFPTIAELAGAKSASFDGESLVPLLLHGEDLRREALFWHFPCYVGRGVPASAIRIGDWKLIEFFETQTVEVYNLAEDPGESRDLAAIDPEHTRELRDKLKAWQRITQAPCPIERNPNYDPNASLLRGRNRRGQQRQTTEAER